MEAAQKSERERIRREREASIKRVQRPVQERNKYRKQLKQAAIKRRQQRHQLRVKETARARAVRKKRRTELRGRAAPVGTELDKQLRRIAHECMDAIPTPRYRAFPGDIEQHGNDTFGVEVPKRARDLIMAQRARLQARESVVLYSDGSLNNAGKADVIMAFGVVVKDNDDQYPTAASGKVEGFASSTKAELAGLFAAILVSPRNIPTTVYIDNSAVVSQFKALVEERNRCTERQRVRPPYAIWWAAVHHAFVQQAAGSKSFGSKDTLVT
ncbi:hypothetical protein BGZ54_005038, partial [Gamsiella multidivaricata]